MNRLDEKFFRLVTSHTQPSLSNPNQSTLYECYEALFPRSTMILVSLKTGTPLAALVLSSADRDVVNLLTARPAPAAGDKATWFQGMVSMDQQEIQLTLANLWPSHGQNNRITFNVLDGEENINEVNVLWAGQVYTIPCDQRTKRAMLVSGVFRVDPVTGVTQPVTVAETEAKDATQKGLVFHLAVAPDEASPDLVKVFKEETKWQCVDRFIRATTILTGPPLPDRRTNTRGFTMPEVYRDIQGGGLLNQFNEPVYRSFPSDGAQFLALGGSGGGVLSAAGHGLGSVGRPGGFGSNMLPESRLVAVPRDEWRGRNVGRGATPVAMSANPEPPLHRRGTMGRGPPDTPRGTASGGFALSMSASFGGPAPVGTFGGPHPVPAPTFDGMSFGGPSPPPSSPPSMPIDLLSSCVGAPSAAERGRAPQHSPAFEAEDVTMTHAVTLAYGEERVVDSRPSELEFNYEVMSPPTVICLSLWTQMKLLPLGDIKTRLAADLKDLTENEGKLILESLNKIFKAEACVLDLEAEADGVICSCGHQCVNLQNIADLKTPLDKCPVCRGAISCIVPARVLCE